MKLIDSKRHSKVQPTSGPCMPGGPWSPFSPCKKKKTQWCFFFFKVIAIILPRCIQVCHLPEVPVGLLLLEVPGHPDDDVRATCYVIFKPSIGHQSTILKVNTEYVTNKNAFFYNCIFVVVFVYLWWESVSGGPKKGQKRDTNHLLWMVPFTSSFKK